MLKRYVPVATMAALLTGAATVAQPQTTTDTGTTGATTTQGTPSSGSTPGSATTESSTSTSTTTGTTTGTGTYGTTRDTSGTSDSTVTDADATRSTTAADSTGTVATAGATALQGQDATFLRKAMEADRMEIAQAQAALDNAQRTDTKNAARMILDDHRASSQKLQELATRKGWTLPNVSTTAESDQALTATGAAGTGSFDDRFMADQIRAHREAIALYRAQASGGQDPDLRQFARDQLPHLEHHLEMLQGSHTQK